MEVFLVFVAVVAVGAWFIWKERKHEDSGSHPLDGATKAPEPWPFPTSRPPEGENKDTIPVMPTLTAVLDVNKDGKVDTKDAVSVLDVNKDGKVDLKDAVAAGDVVVKKTKKAATKVKTKATEAVEKVTKSRKPKK